MPDLYTQLDHNGDGTYTARVVEITKVEDRDGVVTYQHSAPILTYVTKPLPRRELEALTLQKIAERDNPPVVEEPPAPTPEQVAAKAYAEDVALARRLVRAADIGVVAGDLAAVQKRLNDNYRPEYGVFF